MKKAMYTIYSTDNKGNVYTNDFTNKVNLETYINESKEEDKQDGIISYDIKDFKHGKKYDTIIL